MLVFYQIPMTDFRNFIESETGKLQLPSWPVPNPYSDFVRSFGMVKRRRLGGLDGWVGENEICDSSKAIKFSNSLINKKMAVPTRTKIPFYWQCVSRHFYYDGSAVAKFDLVFISQPAAISISSISLLNSLTKLLKCNVTIPSYEKGNKINTLFSSGSALTKHYLHSSTNKKLESRINPKWIKSGSPVVWVEAGAQDDIAIPAQAALISSLPENGLELFHFWLPIQNNEISVWIMKRQNNNPDCKAVSRTMRILLMRLHTERVCFSAVLREIDTGKINFQPEQLSKSLAFDAFQHYLNVKTRCLFKLFGTAETYLEPTIEGECVRTSLEKINPGHYDSLIEKFETMKLKPQIRRKVFEYIKKNYRINQVVFGDHTEIQNLTIIQNA